MNGRYTDGDNIRTGLKSFFSLFCCHSNCYVPLAAAEGGRRKRNRTEKSKKKHTNTSVPMARDFKGKVKKKRFYSNIGGKRKKFRI